MMVRSRFGFVAVGCLLTACAGEVAEEEENPQVTMQAIVGGQPASATYPEAVLLNMRTSGGVGYSCSATVIAPTVVLTAGHCVDGMASWQVISGTNVRSSTKAEVYDWNEGGSQNVNPDHHDIGLVYLTDPIVLSSYPTLATAKQAEGSKAVSVGRVLDGTVTNSLYSGAITLNDGARYGYPFDYASSVVIQHGDSGGPVFLTGTHTLVAVNSGAGSSTQVTARVDLLASWIQSKLPAKTTTPPPAPTPTPAPAPTATCTQEKESNNTFATANVAAASECGSLSGTDADWFTYSQPVGSATITLAPTADATMSVGYVSRGSCLTSINGARSVRITVGNAPLTICIAVSSAKKQSQTYKLTH